MSVRSDRAPVAELVPLVDAWAKDKTGSDGHSKHREAVRLSGSNWRRSVRLDEGDGGHRRPTSRVHDLRHTCASLWRGAGAGADPKVVQRILGYASAAMTMDLYGRPIDQNPWDAAAKFGARGGTEAEFVRNEEAQDRHLVSTWALRRAACRNRTDDLFITSESLYRLS